MIKENIAKVRQRVQNACLRAKIDPVKITLLCVTKGRSIPEILEVLDCGVGCLGENRVQEAGEKHKLIPQAHWQMVGHLQGNKVKEAVRIFELIHSVDTLELAAEINRQAAKINKIQDILLEIKTSPEESKSGFGPQDAAEVCAGVLKFKNLKLRGLMTIPPLSESAQGARPYFAQLRSLRDQLNPGWLLSMGMSADFEVAIEEGADIIRLGRVIFEG